MFMVLSSWQSHCESSPRSFDECKMAPSARQPKTKPDHLGCEFACTGWQSLHPPSPFLQPRSWYSFYRPKDGRRLSRPSWLVTYRDGLPVHRRSLILVLTGSDVAQRGQRVTTKPNRHKMCIVCLWTGKNESDLQLTARVLRPVQNSTWLFTHWRENTLPTLVSHTHHYRWNRHLSLR